MQPGYVRIIAGKWRGRRLRVLDVKTLRPTPDRVRETLFNWLSAVIQGAHCLDLFAGTGALGFEALSRGAASVEMVDNTADIIQLLNEERILLSADNAYVYQMHVPIQWPAIPNPVDIVFLDPPYQADLLHLVASYLEEKDYLAESALYLSGSTSR